MAFFFKFSLCCHAFQSHLKLAIGPLKALIMLNHSLSRSVRLSTQFRRQNVSSSSKTVYNLEDKKCIIKHLPIKMTRTCVILKCCTLSPTFTQISYNFWGLQRNLVYPMTTCKFFYSSINRMIISSFEHLFHWTQKTKHSDSLQDVRYV